METPSDHTAIIAGAVVGSAVGVSLLVALVILVFVMCYILAAHKKRQATLRISPSQQFETENQVKITTVNKEPPPPYEQVQLSETSPTTDHEETATDIEMMKPNSLDTKDVV